jgi:hypothetical protein
VLLRRPGEAARAAAAAGAAVEAQFWATSPRRLRLLALVAAALLLSAAGRAGVALALLFALVTAPLAAAGVFRLLTVASTGLVVDGAFTPWSALSAFSIDGGTGRLVLLRRDAAQPPMALRMGRRELLTAAAALSAHLPEIRAP